MSDSLDPEFGTSSNAQEVADALREVVGIATKLLGERKNIVEVAMGGRNGKLLNKKLTERQWRLVRFGLERALESI